MADILAIDDGECYQPGGLAAWIVCISAGLFFFYEFFQLYLFDVVNQSLSQELQIDAIQLSWLSSTYLWANIIFLIPAGIILDRFSIKRVILTMMAVCLIGTAGFANAHSYAWASFFHFLPGVGNAFCFLACAILASRWFVPRKQGLVIGVVITLAFTGGMFAHAPLVMLNDYVGWRKALQIDSLVGLFIWVIIYFTVKDWPGTTVNQAAQARIPLRKVITNRYTLLPALYTAFLNLPIMVLGALWGMSFLQHDYHMAAFTASSIVSFIFLGSIIGCPLVGWLSDYYGRRKPIMYGGAVATLLTLLPLLFGANWSEPVLYGLFFGLGFFSSTQIISYPYIAEGNEPEATGVATGIASVIIMSFAAIGQILFGWLLHFNMGGDQVGTIVDYKFAMWLFPITIVFALIALFFVRETYCTRA